jgi:hypothetical protein
VEPGEDCDDTTGCCDLTTCTIASGKTCSYALDSTCCRWGLYAAPSHMSFKYAAPSHMLWEIAPTRPARSAARSWLKCGL